MWDELSFYDETRAEAAEDFDLEISETAHRFYNPDLTK